MSSLQFPGPYSYSKVSPVDDVASDEAPSLGYAKGDRSTSTAGLRMSSRKSNLGVIGLLPTVLVIMISLGMGFGMVAYSLKYQYTGDGVSGFHGALKEGAFLILEARGSDKTSVTLHLLTVSSFASTLIQMTGSILMPLIAYRAATRWLKSSALANEANPTPAQYGLLLGLLGVSGVASIVQALQYAFRKKPRRAKMPSIFKEVLIVAIVIYILGHLVGLADLWVHATTTTLSKNQYTPVQSPSLFGTRFNDSLCPPPTDDLHFSNGYVPCISDVGGWGADSPKHGYFIQQSGLALTNSTASQFLPITLQEEGDIAILTPGNLGSYHSYSFNAETIAVQAQCLSLNHLCTGTTPAGKADEMDVILRNCSNVGYPGIRANTNSSYIFGMMDGQMSPPTQNTETIFSTTQQLANPERIAMQLMWPIHGAHFSDDGDMTELDVLPANAAIDIPYSDFELYAACNVSYYNATVRYQPSTSTWSLINKTLSPNGFAYTLYSALIFQLASDALTTEIMGIATVDDYTNVTAALNQALGRASLAIASGAFMPVAATNVTFMEPVILGRYPLVPMGTFIALLFLYAVLAFVIFIWSWGSNSRGVVVPGDLTFNGSDQERSALEITQLWLTSPMPLIAAMFPGKDEPGNDVERTAKTQSLDMIYDGDDTKFGRLTVGLHPDLPGFGLRKIGSGRLAGRVVSMGGESILPHTPGIDEK